MNKPVACHRSDNPERSKIDKIELDSLTVVKLASLIEQLLHHIQSSRDYDILLTSLDSYLGELSNPDEARKSSLLLGLYLEIVPKWLKEAEDGIIQVHESLASVLTANNLGVANTRGCSNE